MKKTGILFLSIAAASTLFTYARRKQITNHFHNPRGKVTVNTDRWAFPMTKSTYQRKFLQEKPIVIIIPSYNNARWYQFNVESVLRQKYNNYRVIYIADGCGHVNYDGTAELVETMVKKHPTKNRWQIIKNMNREGALYNLYHAIHSCEDDAIILTLDGDDWFYHDQVLAEINDIYSGNEIWLTHGRFVEYPTGKIFWSEIIPQHIILQNKFREFKCASHLRTFYAWLFKLIPMEDLLDSTGKFYTMTWDQAIMFPMCEMCGEKQYYVEDFVYVYNTANIINDYKVNAQLQRDLERTIRAKKRYQPLARKP